MGGVRMPDHRRLIKHTRQLAVIILALVFGWSGLSKLLNPEAFSLALYRYHLVPGVTVNVLSLWIASLEVMCAGIVLIIPRLRKPALLVVLGLLVAFTIALGINIIRGSHMACGCFSTSPMATPIGWAGMLRNAGLILLAIHALDWPALQIRRDLNE